MFTIDSHLHLGDCRTFGYDWAEKTVFDALNAAGVDGAILQPFPGCTDVKDTHDRIFELQKNHPGKIFGVCSVNPHLPDEEYEAETTRCIRELGFKALKLHTIGHAVNPMSADGQKVVEMAKTLGVALNVHTGTGIPFSLPSLVLPFAKKFPHPIILAHAGATLLTQEAIIIAQQSENIYLEMSWCAPNQIAMAVNAIGSERVMFGSDSLANLKNELEKFYTIGLSDKQMEDVLYKTAETAFSLK